MVKPSSTLDILLPSYKPDTGWESRILEIHQRISQEYPNVTTHWIIIDDGSDYEYKYSLDRLALGGVPHSFLQHNTNMGKGQSLRTACNKSTAGVIIYTDIDFPYEYDSFTRILDALLAGQAELIYGVRTEEYFLNIPSQRRFISSIVKKMNQYLFKLPSPDTQCGLKGFLSVLKEEFLATKTNRYLIDLEFLHRIAKNPTYKLMPIHVKLFKGTSLGKLKLSSLLSEIGDYFKILFIY